MKTIKQVADEFGVAKHKIKYRLDKVPDNCVDKSGQIIRLTDEGVAILSHLLVDNEPDNSPLLFGELSGGERARYLAIIESQQENIKQLTSALENTTASLHAAQALHAGTMQQQLAASADSAEDQTVGHEAAADGRPELDYEINPPAPGHITLNNERREKEKAWAEYLRPKIEAELKRGKKPWQFWKSGNP